MNAMDKPTGATNLTTIDTTASVDSETDRINVNKWFNIVGDYIQDEDVELASAYLSKISAYLQTYQIELTGDQSQYQWYESQYVKVSQSLVAFLEPYVSGA
jgi:formylmethanofuran dehydrogenase subunit A